MRRDEADGYRVLMELNLCLASQSDERFVGRRDFVDEPRGMSGPLAAPST